MRKYHSMERDGPFAISARNVHPILSDFDARAGQARGHYFFQDLWAAQKIFQRRPTLHLDVGSRIDGFIAHLLTFMSVTILDVRPLESNVAGLTFVQGDATSLRGFGDGSVDSLSSLHAIEHFGLGRYGDPIDPDGWHKALLSLQRVLRVGGRLYVAVPAGRERLCFNAHRIFSPRRIIDTLADLKLVSFSGVDDDGAFLKSPTFDDLEACVYGCGLFEFTK
jgi:SAM-dependent methyltransferase